MKPITDPSSRTMRVLERRREKILRELEDAEFRRNAALRKTVRQQREEREALRRAMDARIAHMVEVEKIPMREISRRFNFSSARASQIYQRVLRNRGPLAGLPMRARTCLWEVYTARHGYRDWQHFKPTPEDYVTALRKGDLHPGRTKNYGTVTHRELIAWLVARGYLSKHEMRDLTHTA